MKNIFNIFILFLVISVSAHAAVVQESGDLESYLNSISFGVEDDGRFQIPTAGQLADFENVVNLVLQSDYDSAHAAAQALGYELVAYTDSATAKLFYMLREVNPIPSPLANGNGIYLFRPAAAYNVAIHAPHPAADRIPIRARLQLSWQAMSATS